MKLVEVFIHLIILFLKQSAASDSGTLKSLFVAFRHGARAPFAIYNENPYNETSWPNGLGELTTHGKRQMFQIGQFLRSNYSHFLSGSVEEVEVRSSASARLIESAESVWEGFISADDARNRILPIRVDEVYIIYAQFFN